MQKGTECLRGLPVQWIICPSRHFIMLDHKTKAKPLYWHISNFTPDSIVIDWEIATESNYKTITRENSSVNHGFERENLIMHIHKLRAKVSDEQTLWPDNVISFLVRCKLVTEHTLARECSLNDERFNLPHLGSYLFIDLRGGRDVTSKSLPPAPCSKVHSHI